MLRISNSIAELRLLLIMKPEHSQERVRHVKVTFAFGHPYPEVIVQCVSKKLIQAAADFLPCREGEEDFRLIKKTRTFLPDTIEVIDLQRKLRNARGKPAAMFSGHSILILAVNQSSAANQINRIGRPARCQIARALAGTLPELVKDSDIAGILHAHTDRSDGVDTLKTMAEATRSRGYQYFGVCDHSKSAHYAGGLSVEEIAEQQAEADALNRKYGSAFRVFKGIESDILPDGSLDYPDDVLARFDFIVASVHGQFEMDRAAQTERIIRAVSNPYTTIQGHMTGRQLLRRPGK